MSFFAQEQYEAHRPMPVFVFDPTKVGLERWLGCLETPIMEILWDADGARIVKRVWRELKIQYGRDLAYTTVMSTMGRLWEKGMLSRRKTGYVYSYTVRETREQFEERQTRIVRAALEGDHA